MKIWKEEHYWGREQSQNGRPGKSFRFHPERYC